MTFKQCLTKQLELHPAMQQQDLLKLCFQAAFGAEHLIENHQYARAVLEEEFASVPAEDLLLYEEISDEVIRINLAAWKFRNLPVDWLLNIFISSAKQRQSGMEKFNEYINECRTVTDASAWDGFICNYMQDGLRPIHHSDYYREKEKPSYRLANKSYVRIFPVLEEIAKSTSEPCVIAIDGRAASGKSTIAGELSAIVNADVIHMDDFFLPLTLRNAERLTEAGGNIHYERFIEEVIPKISAIDGFSYQVFSSSKMDFDGRREISSAHCRIVEGVYCLHPKFGDYADVTVFSDVDPKLQMERIVKRDGPRFAERFSSSWIPMEEQYFNIYKIEEKCKLHIK